MEQSKCMGSQVLPFGRNLDWTSSAIDIFGKNLDLTSLAGTSFGWTSLGLDEFWCIWKSVFEEFPLSQCHYCVPLFLVESQRTVGHVQDDDSG